jgi:hypothetical protein
VSRKIEKAAVTPPPVRTQADALLSAEINRVPDPTEVEGRIQANRTRWMERFGLTPSTGFQVLEKIEDPGLVRAAEAARRQLENGFDHLMRELAKGNLNPGLGTKPVFGTILEARGRTGARVYFRHAPDGIEILALSTKGDQDRVISKLRELYG